MFNSRGYTAQDLCDAVKDNNAVLVEKITTGCFPPDKNNVDAYFSSELINHAEFGIKVNPDILLMLSETGYFSVTARFLYFSKNNEFEALKHLLQNLKFNKSDFNSVKAKARAALHLAINQEGDLSIIKLLSGLKGVSNLDRASALFRVAKLYHKQDVEMANILLPNSLLIVNKSLVWTRYHVRAWEEALEREKLWLIEMLMKFPVPGFFSEFLMYHKCTPLSYALSQNIKDESILLFLIKHALNTDRFSVRFEEIGGEVFFEKTDDAKKEYLWDMDELKSLFKMVVHFHKQTDELLIRFPNIFKPIAEAILKEKCFVPFHTRNLGELQYRTLLGKVLEKHGVIESLQNTNTYKVKCSEEDRLEGGETQCRKNKGINLK